MRIVLLLILLVVARAVPAAEQITRVELAGMPTDVLGQAELRTGLLCAPGTVLTPAMLPLDTASITRQLQDVGFLDATVATTQAGGVITHTATPGSRYHLRHIRVAGRDDAAITALLTAVQVGSGDPCTAVAQARLTAQLPGYQVVRSVDPVQKTVDLAFQVAPAP